MRKSFLSFGGGSCGQLVDEALAVYALVGKTDSEPNIKGTREALNDSLRTSMSIIRRRIKSPRLRFELIRAGKIANIELCIVYLEGKTPKGLVDETRKSLEKIDSDLVLTSGGIIPYMTGSSGTFFSGVSTTERPDVLCSKINEGRIAVLIDGVPFAVTAPALFIENFQVVDDYAERSYFATFQRFIRFAAFFISALLPYFARKCGSMLPVFASTRTGI